MKYAILLLTLCACGQIAQTELHNEVTTRSPCNYCGISFYSPATLARDYWFDAIKIQGTWRDIDAHVVQSGALNITALQNAACLIHSHVYRYGAANLDFVNISFDELERSCSGQGAQWHINLCMAYFCKVHAQIDSIRIQRVACGPGVQTFTLPTSDNCFPADACIGESNWEAQCSTSPF